MRQRSKNEYKNNSDAENDGVCGENADQHKDQDKLQRQTDSTRIFMIRDSPLTILMETGQLRFLYIFMMAICIDLFIVALTFYIANPQEIIDDVKMVWWVFGKKHWHSLVVCIVGLLYQDFIGIIIHQMLRLWEGLRHHYHKKLMDGIFLICYGVCKTLLYVGSTFLCIYFDLPPATSFVLIGELLRKSMKIYSMIRELYPSITNEDLQKEKNKVFCPPFVYFCKYMYYPVLLYRESYPRNEKTNWTAVGQHLVHFAINSVVFMYLNAILIPKYFRTVGISPLNWTQVIQLYLLSLAVGVVSLLIVFCNYYHVSYNICAEILRFGDRQFYQDWWNSNTFSTFYRKWNIVYEWLHEYVYKDVRKLGFNREIAKWLTLLISALYHDFFVGLALKSYLPAFIVTFGISAALLMLIIERKQNPIGGIFVFACIFFGCGLNIFLYAMEYYCKKNCSKITFHESGCDNTRILFCFKIEDS